MAKRKIITIDEAKCNGCGLCAKACAEGAIQIINGKAKLVSETYCDGLGACIGKCPQDAITLEDREAAEFDPKAVEAHLGHHSHQAAQPAKEKLPCGCPGTMTQSFARERSVSEPQNMSEAELIPSELRNWPVQLKLVPVTAPYLNGARLVIAADCVPFAFADFHRQFLADRVLLVGCPKLDDVELYRQKLAAIFRENDIKSIEVVHMEVPCCFGLIQLVSAALHETGKTIPFKAIKIGIRGGVIDIQEHTKESKCSCCK